MDRRSNWFSSEMDVVLVFCQQLQKDPAPWACTSFSREFDYRRGRTDVIAINKSGEVFAFEAKTTDWRTALHQAYRNTCFADFSYVVLPQEGARQASRAEFEFARRSVGLCSVNPDGIDVLIEAPQLDPVQPWLREIAASDLERA